MFVPRIALSPHHTLIRELVESELETRLVVLVGLCVAEPIVNRGVDNVQSRFDGRIFSEKILGLEAVLGGTSLATNDVKTLGKQCITNKASGRTHQQ